MYNFEVREITDSEYDLWDKLVDDSPYGTIFSKIFWLKLSNEFLNGKLRILGVFEGEKLKGGCSFFTYTSKGLFKVGASTYSLTPYGGIVLLDPTERNNNWKQYVQNIEIIRLLSSAINELNLDYIQFSLPPGFNDLRPFTQNEWKCFVHYTYLLDLQSLDETKFSRNTRRNLKKANENNIHIETGFKPSTFYELFSKMYERQNLKSPFPVLYFQKIANLLENNGLGEMMIAETSSGETASVHITLWDNKRAYSWLMASNMDLIQTGSSHLLISEITKDLKIRGFSEFDLMRGNVPHLSRFAMNFNPILVSCFEVEKTNLKLEIINRLKTLIMGADKQKDDPKADNE